MDLNGNTGGRTSGQSFVIDMTLPILIFTGSTPASGAMAGTLSTGQLDITELNLGQFIRFQGGVRNALYDSGLVLMYNFDNVTALGESAGSVVKDFSQYNNTGSLYNGVLRTGNGQWNGAYWFDGVNDYMSAGNNAVLDSTGNFTVSIRVKSMNNTTGLAQGIITKANINGNEYGWMVDKEQDNTFHFRG